jgi:hypothetical protein
VSASLAWGIFSVDIIRLVVSPSLAFVSLLCKQLTLISVNLLLKLSILRMKAVIFFFEALGRILEGDISLNLALFIELDARLKLSELRLLTLPESTLSGSFGYTKSASLHSKNTDRTTYLFWTRRPLTSVTYAQMG